MFRLELYRDVLSFGDLNFLLSKFIIFYYICIVKNCSSVKLNELREQILQMLFPVVPIHMDFKVEPENTVYMMLGKLEEAKTTLITFHSNVVNGRLILGKYVRDARYMERYPESKIVYKVEE